MNTCIPTGIEQTPSFEAALAAMNGTANVFITGKAGSGKSTLLAYWRATTARENAVVLAPTGIAALNVGGQTIHSFFGFRPSITIDDLPTPRPDKQKILKALTTIVIDEISMVRADLLDCMDAMLRRWGPVKNTPFGGVHAIFIGDLYQLPPVVRSEDYDFFGSLYPTPYFFSAHCFSHLDMDIVELTKIYRQTDTTFIDILNAIRTNTVTNDHIAILNKRVSSQSSHNALTVTLTTTNATADTINARSLARLSGKSATVHANTSGTADALTCPAPAALSLKIGAQVMIVANDPHGSYVNGTMGTVTALPKKKVGGATTLTIRTDAQKTITIAPYTWESYTYAINAQTRRIAVEVAGTVTQFPVRLAWALTIHKSQGKTFRNVIIDFGRGTFVHGHAYVALSRAVSLDGLTLTRPFERRHVLLDRAVVDFMKAATPH